MRCKKDVLRLLVASPGFGCRILPLLRDCKPYQWTICLCTTIRWNSGVNWLFPTQSFKMVSPNKQIILIACHVSLSGRPYPSFMSSYAKLPAYRSMLFYTVLPFFSTSWICLRKGIAPCVGCGWSCDNRLYGPRPDFL